MKQTPLCLNQLTFGWHKVFLRKSWFSEYPAMLDHGHWLTQIKMGSYLQPSELALQDNLPALRVSIPFTKFVCSNNRAW
jgi:hypothetical protein